MTENQTVDVEVPASIHAKIEETRKPHQTLNERYVELIEAGLKACLITY